MKVLILSLFNDDVQESFLFICCERIILLVKLGVLLDSFSHRQLRELLTCVAKKVSNYGSDCKVNITRSERFVLVEINTRLLR